MTARIAGHSSLFSFCFPHFVSLRAWTALFPVGRFLQFLGHAVFERRRPAFVDDLSQTLIGPMFVVAKMLVKPGMRRDLARFMAEERRPVLKQPG